MSDFVCSYPLIVHRVNEPGNTASEFRALKLFECVELNCLAAPGAHIAQLPCRWSWQMAHGKVFNGQPFPKRRCPGCAHIRRAGAPEAVIDSQHLGEAG